MPPTKTSVTKMVRSCLAVGSSPSGFLYALHLAYKTTKAKKLNATFFSQLFFKQAKEFKFLGKKKTKTQINSHVQKLKECVRVAFEESGLTTEKFFSRLNRKGNVENMRTFYRTLMYNKSQKKSSAPSAAPSVPTPPPRPPPRSFSVPTPPRRPVPSAVPIIPIFSVPEVYLGPVKNSIRSSIETDIQSLHNNTSIDVNAFIEELVQKQMQISSKVEPTVERRVLVDEQARGEEVQSVDLIKEKLPGLKEIFGTETKTYIKTSRTVLEPIRNIKYEYIKNKGDGLWRPRLRKA